jgi:hypothetical protein
MVEAMQAPNRIQISINAGTLWRYAKATAIERTDHIANTITPMPRVFVAFAMCVNRRAIEVSKTTIADRLNKEFNTDIQSTLTAIKSLTRA